MDVPAEVGPHHARGEGVDGDARAVQAPRQLAGEKQVGQLALAVAEGLVVVSSAVQVIKIDVAVLVELGRDHHDAAGCRGLQQVEEQVRKQEVAKVVNAQLHLEAFLRLGVWALEDASIVYKHIDLGLLLTRTEKQWKNVFIFPALHRKCVLGAHDSDM